MALATWTHEPELHEDVLASGQRLNDDLTVLGHLGGSRRVDIYLCRSRRLRASVAVKALRPHLWDDADAVKALLREGETLTRLRHPHIVEGYEVSTLGRPHIVMEALSSVTLEDALFEGNYQAFGVEDFVEIALGLADALSYAHKSGVLHLDVKPANVLYQDGTPYLIDFSVARPYSPGHVVRSGAGTCAYMAPEQCFDGALGPYTDVFGLGVLFYQMLTGGVMPYEVSGTGQADPVLDYERAALSPAILNPAVPEAVAAVALRAIHPDPTRRFPTPQAFRQALLQA